MIGKLLHYNCAGSSELAIVTRSFIYRGPNIPEAYGLASGDWIIAVSWIRGSNRTGLRPKTINPGLIASRRLTSSNHYSVISLGAMSEQIESYFPDNWSEERWYLSGWFKEISSN